MELARGPTGHQRGSVMLKEDPWECLLGFGIFQARTFHHKWPNLVWIMVSSNKRFEPIAFDFCLIFLYLNEQKFKCGSVVDKSKRLIHPNLLLLLIKADMSFSRHTRHLNFLSNTIRQRLIIFLDDFYPCWSGISRMFLSSTGCE